MSDQSYTLGMCELWWAIGVHDSSSRKQFRHLGNIVAGEVTPDITYLDHYKCIEGDRRKDKTVAVTKSVSIPFTFDEISEENIKDFMYALDTSAAKKSSVLQKVNVPIEGRAILRLKTNVGQDFSYTIPKCALKADGGLSFNAEDWMTGKFVIEVLNTSTYSVPDATSYKAPYGYVDTNLDASLVVDACESGWVKGPVTTATEVQVSHTATPHYAGSAALKVVVATYWNYDSAGVVATNCLAYKTITATNITPYTFLEFQVRASRDFTASTLYIGVESTATPIGVPLDYVPLDAITTTKQWETQTLPIRNRSAGLTAVRCIALYGTSKIDSALATSIQTVWIDNVRCVK